MKIITNKEEALIQIKKNVLNTRFISKKLKNDKDVVLAAVTQSGCGYFLQYASQQLKKNKEVVLTAVQQSGLALQYASKEIRNNKEVVLAAVQEYVGALEYASDTLKNDKEVVLTAVQQDGSTLKFASKELKDSIGINNPISRLKELIQIEQDKINLESKIVTQNKITHNIIKVIKI